jgi:hypothetical protein
MDDRDHRVRLTAFKASDFRSLRNVSLGEDPPPKLPPIVLLYGENDTGKSNLIQAVGVWLRIAQTLAGALSNGASGSDTSVDLYEGNEGPLVQRNQRKPHGAASRPRQSARRSVPLWHRPFRARGRAISRIRRQQRAGVSVPISGQPRVRRDVSLPDTESDLGGFRTR